jgi:phospholipid transport system substrate-binding protein
MKPVQWCVAVMMAGVALAGPAPASAGAPSQQLRGQVDRVLKVLDDPALKKETRLAERRLVVRTIANEIFDFNETARRCLGTHWQARTAPERQEFARLFADLLERAYFGRIEQYSGEKIEYVGESGDGDQATVRTRLVTKQGTAIPVDYRMHRTGERWLAYDVAIEGVSLVANYRAQFNRIVQSSGYEGLVTKLRAKHDEGAQLDAMIQK